MAPEQAPTALSTAKETELPRISRSAFAVVGLVSVAGLGLGAVSSSLLGSSSSTTSPNSASSITSATNLPTALLASEAITSGPVQQNWTQVSSPGAAVFPVGTTYAEGVRAIFLASQGGSLPAGTTLRPPLPKGVVAVQPNATRGVIIDLAYPYGYSVARGFVAGPALSLPNVSPSEAEQALATASAQGRKWPVGMTLTVATLPACMVLSSESAVPQTCDASRGGDTTYQTGPQHEVPID